MTTCVFNPALETSAKLLLHNFPGIEFATQSFQFPEFRTVFPNQAYPGQVVHMPPAGVEYGDFNLTFIVSSDMQNYVTLVKWLQQAPKMEVRDVFSDASVVFTDSLKRPNGLTATFTDLMPFHVSALQYQYNIENPQPLVAAATFKYTQFNFE